MKLHQISLRSLSLGAILLDRALVSSAFLSQGIPSQSITRNDVTSYSTSTRIYESKMDQSFPTWSFDGPCKSMDWTGMVDVPLTIKTATDGSLADADLVIVGVMAPPPKEEEEEDNEGDEEKEIPPMNLSGFAKTVDDILSGALSDLISENGKTFKNGATLGSMTPSLRTIGAKPKRYVVLGLGPSKTKEGENPDWTGSGFALGKAIATKVKEEKKIQSANILLPEAMGSNATIAKDISAGFYETLYTDNRYRTKANKEEAVKDLKEVKILVEGSSAASQLEIDNGKKLATGVFLTKDIVNAPHNVLNSESLADTAKRIAKESNGRIKCTILDKNECEKRGMGAYLGVARGSETEPQFIHLTYTPPSGEVVNRVGVIGKGLLFDTGGYNIKTQMMELMKFDCGGSAAVLGAARAVGQLAPEGVEAHFIVAACENMISGKAMVPSDILTASNGKTIEVMNTDAEGRLTLADALVYADKELGCEEIIELSTLTGACMVALGKQICGVWTDNDGLAKELEDISKATGDKSWRMPMAKEYKEQLKSMFADIKNLGTPYGGSITAALFLQEFVSAKKPFAHIDIAGPVWDDKVGATGFGAKMVTEWVTKKGKEESIL